VKRVLVALMFVALVAVPAFAGTNPHVRAFITFDPVGHVYSSMPAVGTIVNFYLAFDCYGQGGGLTGVSLVLDIQAGGFVAGAADYTVFHPAAQCVIGGPDVLTGWVIAAPECVHPPVSGIITVAKVPFYYLSPAGNLVILPSPVDGKATVDCNNDLDFFCVLSNGAIGMLPTVPGDPNCVCAPPSAVDDASWGTIKALYR
jgi:hypothetical protein